MWTRSDDCRKIIQEQWEKGVAAVGLEGIRENCQNVGKALSYWNWATFGHVQRKIKVLREKLTCIQAYSSSAENEEVE
ncbi:hypothetical protein U1Q18_033098, partial [Sarracenia purpurea var. burkii]